MGAVSSTAEQKKVLETLYLPMGPNGRRLAGAHLAIKGLICRYRPKKRGRPPRAFRDFLGLEKRRAGARALDLRAAAVLQACPSTQTGDHCRPLRVHIAAVPGSDC